MLRRNVAQRTTCIAAITTLLFALSGCITINTGGSSSGGEGSGLGGSCPDGSFSNKEITGGQVSNLVFDGSWDVNFKIGDEQKIVVSGTVPEDAIKANISDTTLTLQSRCSQRSTADVTVKSISGIKVNNSASAEASSGSADEIAVDVDNGSGLKMDKVEAKKATVKVDNGSTADFAATDATVTMNNGSSGSAVVSGTLDVDMDNGSNLTYTGGATIGKQNLKNGSNLNPG